MLTRSMLVCIFLYGIAAMPEAKAVPAKAFVVATGTIKPEAAEADRRLNKVYGEVMNEYANAREVKAAIIQSQVRWIAFRDAECDLWAKGPMPQLLHHPSAAISYGIRQRDLTLDRIKVLETLLSASKNY